MNCTELYWTVLTCTELYHFMIQFYLWCPNHFLIFIKFACEFLLISWKDFFYVKTARKIFLSFRGNIPCNLELSRNVRSAIACYLLNEILKNWPPDTLKFGVSISKGKKKLVTKIVDKGNFGAAVEKVSRNLHIRMLCDKVPRIKERAGVLVIFQGFSCRRRWYYVIVLS